MRAKPSEIPPRILFLSLGCTNCCSKIRAYWTKVHQIFKSAITEFQRKECWCQFSTTTLFLQDSVRRLIIDWVNERWTFLSRHSVLLCSLAVATPCTYFLHLSLSSVILTDSSTESPIDVLMLSIQAVHGLPRLRAPSIVPCIISFSRQLPCFLIKWR